MTYCVGLWLEQGLVMLADTRTNAGVDNIATYSKMYTAVVPGERVLCLMAAGNLAITQAVWSRLGEGVLLEGEKHTLYSVGSMFRAAQLVGAAVRAVYEADGPMLRAQDVRFDVSIMLGGQIAGGPQRLYLVYAAGNFIEATPDTPYLQIGEHKYGKLSAFHKCLGGSDPQAILYYAARFMLIGGGAAAPVWRRLACARPRTPVSRTRRQSCKCSPTGSYLSGWAAQKRHCLYGLSGCHVATLPKTNSTQWHGARRRLLPSGHRMSRRRSTSSTPLHEAGEAIRLQRRLTLLRFQNVPGENN